MLTNFTIEKLIILIPVVLIAITFHELAHGWVAHQLGDPTPKAQGRITLNPISHLDPLGALLILIAGFGWAKPVEVNPFYFKGDRNRGMMYVAIAGPMANVLIAFLGLVVYNLFGGFTSFGILGATFINYLILINIYLAAFNLLPVPPLDGSKILAGLLPRGALKFMDILEGYGPIILILLIATGMTRHIIMPIVSVLFTIVTGLAKLIGF